MFLFFAPAGTLNAVVSVVMGRREAHTIVKLMPIAYQPNTNHGCNMSVAFSD